MTVNVYDMSWLNEYIGNIGLGVFHTGVEVYNRGELIDISVPCVVKETPNL